MMITAEIIVDHIHDMLGRIDKTDTSYKAGRQAALSELLFFIIFSNSYREDAIDDR